MASRQARKIADQLDRNLINLRVDLRRNAQAYKAAFGLGRTVEQVADVMAKDAAQYIRRIKWHADFRAAKPVLYTEALAHLGETDTQHEAECKELRDAAVIQRDGAKTTQAGIEALADQVLSAVADHGSLWESG